MVKVGDKVRCLVDVHDVHKGGIYTVYAVTTEGPVSVDGIEVLDDVGDNYLLTVGEYEPIAHTTTPLQYFTMNALVESVSKAIDAGDTQSARAIIDAMEGK